MTALLSGYHPAGWPPAPRPARAPVSLWIRAIVRRNRNTTVRTHVPSDPFRARCLYVCTMPQGAWLYGLSLNGGDSIIGHHRVGELAPLAFLPIDAPIAGGLLRAHVSTAGAGGEMLLELRECPRTRLERPCVDCGRLLPFPEAFVVAPALGSGARLNHRACSECTILRLQNRAQNGSR